MTQGGLQAKIGDVKDGKHYPAWAHSASSEWKRLFCKTILSWESSCSRGWPKASRVKFAVRKRRALALLTMGRGVSASRAVDLCSINRCNRYHAVAETFRNSEGGFSVKSSSTRGKLPSRRRRSAAFMAFAASRQRIQSKRDGLKSREAGSKLSRPSIKPTHCPRASRKMVQSARPLPACVSS